MDWEEVLETLSGILDGSQLYYIFQACINPIIHPFQSNTTAS